MCSRSYREDVPCDVPYMLAEDGSCSVLIEDHLAAQGPSRWVYMSYTMVIALSCFGFGLWRVADLWRKGKEKRRSQAWGIFGHFRMQAAISETYAALMVFLKAVDFRGYGGRVHFIAAAMFQDHVVVGILSAAACTLMLWGLASATPQEALDRQQRIRVTKHCIVFVLVLSLTVLPICESLTRPSDASLGVTDGRVGAAKVLITLAVIAVLDYVMVREYLHLRARLAAGRRNRVVVSYAGAVASATAGKSRNVSRAEELEAGVESDAEAREESSKPSTREASTLPPGSFTSKTGGGSLRPTALQGAPTEARPSQGERLSRPTLRSSLGRRSSIGTSRDSTTSTRAARRNPDDGTLAVLTKYTAIAFTISILVGAFLIFFAAVGINECFLYHDRADTEWGDIGTTLELVSIVGFLMASSKVCEPCLGKMSVRRSSMYSKDTGASGTRDRPSRTTRGKSMVPAGTKPRPGARLPPLRFNFRREASRPSADNSDAKARSGSSVEMEEKPFSAVDGTPVLGSLRPSAEKHGPPSGGLREMALREREEEKPAAGATEAWLGHPSQVLAIADLEREESELRSGGILELEP